MVRNRVGERKKEKKKNRERLRRAQANYFNFKEESYVRAHIHI